MAAAEEKMKASALIGSLLFITSLAQCLALDRATVDAIAGDLRTTIDTTEGQDGTKFLIPGIVRMVFHDCVDGCDACLNLDAAINVGLERIVNALEPIYQKYKNAISRADLWALASKIALEMSSKLNNDRCNNRSCKTPRINIRVQFGRKDCPTSPIHSDDVFIPSPFQTSEVLMPWFQEQFGFNPNNVVAIMGLHTLGKVGPPFNKAWEPENKDGLSNLYFKQMADSTRGWTQDYFDPQLTGLPINLFFWKTKESKAFALPIDMTLLKDIQVTATGESTCTYDDCDDASTAGLFNRYANDVHSWTKDIETLFPRILEKTSSQLQPLSDMP